MSTDIKHIAREARKLMHILHTFGNVLVLNGGGQGTIAAKHRLDWLVLQAMEQGLSLDDFQAVIDGLNQPAAVPA